MKNQDKPVSVQEVKKCAWQGHLEGYTTQEIAYHLKRNLRWVQLAIKEYRDKYPAKIERDALKKYARHLNKTSNLSVPTMIKRIKAVFNITLTLAQFREIVGEAEKKVCKKDKKKCCCNKASKRKPSAETMRKKFPKPTQLASSVSVTTKENKAVFSNAMKSLDKNGKCRKLDKTSRHLEFDDFLREAIVKDKTLMKFCKQNKMSIDELMKEMTCSGVISSVIDECVQELARGNSLKAIIFTAAMA